MESNKIEQMNKNEEMSEMNEAIKIKRYDITGIAGRGGVFSAKTIETPEGEFVKYSDVVKLKQKLKESRLQNVADNYHVPYLNQRVAELEQQIERDHNVICEINNDKLILKQNVKMLNILVELYKLICLKSGADIKELIEIIEQVTGLPIDE